MLTSKKIITMIIWIALALPQETADAWVPCLESAGLEPLRESKELSLGSPAYWLADQASAQEVEKLARDRKLGLLLLGDSPVVALARVWEQEKYQELKTALREVFGWIPFPMKDFPRLFKDRLIHLPQMLCSLSKDSGVGSMLQPYLYGKVELSAMEHKSKTNNTKKNLPVVRSLSFAAHAVAIHPELSWLQSAISFTDAYQFLHRSNPGAANYFTEKLNNLEEERNFILLQLHQVQSELEECFLEKSRHYNESQKVNQIHQSLEIIERLLNR